MQQTNDCCPESSCKLDAPCSGHGEQAGIEHDGRVDYIYALTNEWGRSWIGAPLTNVLERIRSDSRGAIRLNACRAYKHAREQRRDGRYHGFRVDRRPKESVDWQRLREASPADPNTVTVCFPSVKNRTPPPRPRRPNKRRRDATATGGDALDLDEGPRFVWTKYEAEAGSAPVAA
jgi:hypothetical protein